MKRLVFCASLLLAANTFAEVYKWTDADGKVHYSDKKPAEKKAEDITEKTKTVNIDSSSAEHKKLESLFRKENEADREYQRQQSRPDPELLKRCAEAREYLRKISGRVVFVDDQGNIVNTTEAERTKKVKDMKELIAEHCPDQE